MNYLQNIMVKVRDRSGMKNIRVKKLKQEIQNLRKDFRVPVDINICVQSPMCEDPVHASVKNISARGMLFWSEQIFLVGSHIFFTLPIGENKWKLEAVIINQILTSDEDVWGYGCQFVAQDLLVEAKLRRFAFEQQLLHRKLGDYEHACKR